MKCDNCLLRTTCTYDTARTIMQGGVEVTCEGYQKDGAK